MSTEIFLWQEIIGGGSAEIKRWCDERTECSTLVPLASSALALFWFFLTEGPTAHNSKLVCRRGDKTNKIKALPYSPATFQIIWNHSISAHHSIKRFVLFIPPFGFQGDSKKRSSCLLFIIVAITSCRKVFKQDVTYKVLTHTLTLQRRIKDTCVEK